VHPSKKSERIISKIMNQTVSSSHANELAPFDRLYKNQNLAKMSASRNRDVKRNAYLDYSQRYSSTAEKRQVKKGD
jgi:hypothetical protein